MQEIFVREYLIDLNATQAAKRAGYSNAEYGRQLITFPYVQRAIDRAMKARAKRLDISADKVLAELALIGFSDMKDYAEWDNQTVKLKSSATLKGGKSRAVAEVSQTVTKDGGSIRFKLHDKRAALVDIGRHLGMFNEKKPDEDDQPLPWED